MENIATIVRLHKELIEIQKVKTPSAVQGLAIKQAQYEKINEKLTSNRKLTKFETLQYNQAESTIVSLNDYVDFLLKQNKYSI